MRGNRPGMMAVTCPSDVPTASFIVRIELLLNTLKMSSWNVCTFDPVPDVLLEVDIELIPALAEERSRFGQDERLRLRALAVREEVCRRLPCDDALEAAEALQNRADVYAELAGCNCPPA